MSAAEVAGAAVASIAGPAVKEIALAVSHRLLQLGARYLRAVLEQQKRLRETREQTAARHQAEDRDYWDWLAGVRARAV